VEEKKTRKPRTVKGRNTITAPDGTSEVTAVDQVTTKAPPPVVENTPTPPPAPEAPKPTGYVFASDAKKGETVEIRQVNAGPEPEKVEQLMLFIDCIPEGYTVKRLETFAQELAQHIADKAQVADIRIQEQGPLSHGKWKGVLAAMARANKPKGTYVVSTGSGEITSTVLEALLPFADFRVRGLR
jgi:hypothetical protein